ncbi:MAG: hydantoin utilization protein A, partial [Spirulina sp. SIO3F2]|nr:hydantoin utilization protein A [Spirulina sp. SIO3F2]
MLNQLLRLRTHNISFRPRLNSMLLMAGLSVSALWLATPAFAHHPFGGTTPASFMEGILSGLG